MNYINFFNLLYNKNKKINFINFINIEEKYLYYNKLIINNNVNEIKIFSNTQKIYFLIIKFINKIIIKLFDSNDRDLYGNEFSTFYFKVIFNKYIYKFSYAEFINIIKHSLLNYIIEDVTYIRILLRENKKSIYKYKF